MASKSEGGVLLDREVVSASSVLYPYLLNRKRTHFVLWRPRHVQPTPKLRIGVFQAGNPPSLAEEKILELQRSEDFPDLWEIQASGCSLVDGQNLPLLVSAG